MDVLSVDRSEVAEIIEEGLAGSISSSWVHLVETCVAWGSEDLGNDVFFRSQVVDWWLAMLEADSVLDRLEPVGVLEQVPGVSWHQVEDRRICHDDLGEGGEVQSHGTAIVSTGRPDEHTPGLRGADEWWSECEVSLDPLFSLFWGQTLEDVHHVDVTH